MNLEHCRKDAKRLFRAVREGDAEAVKRAHARLGARAGTGRLRLSDAQHVVAVERGFRSWPELTRALTSAQAPDRQEALLETGLEYRPGDPVRVRTVHRGHRTSVSDDGAAVARAGRPAAWRDAAARTAEELVVNISRQGVVSLPVVRAGPSEAEVIRRIAEASLRFYEELLDLESA